MCTHRKNSIYGLRSIPGFRRPLGLLEPIRGRLDVVPRCFKPSISPAFLSLALMVLGPLGPVSARLPLARAHNLGDQGAPSPSLAPSLAPPRRLLTPLLCPGQLQAPSSAEPTVSLISGAGLSEPCCAHSSARAAPGRLHPGLWWGIPLVHSLTFLRPAPALEPLRQLPLISAKAQFLFSMKMV